jgi:hypothetical protein
VYDTAAISGNVALVLTYQNGRWTKVTRIPGLMALDTIKSSAVNSVSYTPTGKCAAGCRYSNTELQIRPAFVVDEINGSWGQARTVRVASGPDIEGTCQSCQMARANPNRPGPPSGHHGDIPACRRPLIIIGCTSAA